MELGAVPGRHRAWVHGVAVGRQGWWGGVGAGRQRIVGLDHRAVAVRWHRRMALMPGGSLQGPGPQGGLGQWGCRGLARGGGTIIVDGVVVVVVGRVHRGVERHELPFVRLVRAPAEELVAAPPQLRPKCVHHHGLADASREWCLWLALRVHAALWRGATGPSRRRGCLVD